MRKPFPRSLVGQMALLFAGALLLAQLVSLGYILVQRQQFIRAQVDAPAITRFTSTAADVVQADPAFQQLVVNDASRRGAHYALEGAASVGLNSDRRDDTEARLRQSLAGAGIRVGEVRAATDTRPPATAGPRRHHGQSMLLSAQLAGNRWLNARIGIPAPPPLLTPGLWVGILLVYLFVLAAAVLIATRIARPLRNLTRAAEAFRGRNAPITVEPSGPADLRDAILAFNAMNDRVVRLLEEKDRTLGAIGHDLRTPLASLRIRAESVEPEEDRDRMIASIEEMAAMLEDILTLARSGRSREGFEETDLTSLARSVVDEFREMGQRVQFESDSPNIAAVQPGLVRRAVRNLVDNSIKYAGSAEVDVRKETDAIVIAVLDRGPGLPPADLAKVSSAFYRGEPSRNRETGGAGLGLAIAEAVADAHGGKLVLANRERGGLAATLSLPLAA